MKLYQQQWWKKWFRKPAAKKVDSVKDILAVMDFLQEARADSKVLDSSLRQLLELEKERQVASPGVVQVNISAQARNLDKIIERFEFLESDVAINSIRLKYIAEALLKEARRQGLRDLAAEKQKKWGLDW